MDEQTKELIAIGAAIGAHCQPCLTYHVKKAQDLGVSEDCILSAIEVGHMVEKGAMAAMRDFAKGVMSGTVLPAAVPSYCGGVAPKSEMTKSCCSKRKE